MIVRAHHVNVGDRLVIGPKIYPVTAVREMGAGSHLCILLDIGNGQTVIRQWQETVVLAETDHGNQTATEGCSRCECGCKYWEGDRCIDCGTVHDAARHDDW